MATPPRSTSSFRWLSADEQSAWRGLLRLQAALAAVLNRELAQRGTLSLSDYAVLVELSEAPEGRLRANVLSHALGWEKSRLSHHVARMGARGLVARERCSSDRRGANVAITASGRTALAQAAPAHVAAVRRLFIDVLGPTQLAALRTITDAALAALAPECAAGDDPSR
jgi:DNA-binding MarR family transcriptional regulator